MTSAAVTGGTAFGGIAAALTRFAPLDPAKHVKFTLGMVLGVDDLDQEFTYSSARDQWLARDLAGYGTVWGLAVEVTAPATGAEVRVAPGVAVTPCGQLVCVTPAQCAVLDTWLAGNADAVRKRLAATPGPLALHVTLGYRDWPTDDLPIPGEPCRTEESLTAPSRLQDGFRLALRLDPPPQREEDAIRDVVAWLRQVPLVDGAGSTQEQLLAELRAAFTAGPLSPPLSPPISPPMSPPVSPPLSPPADTGGLPPPPSWLAIPAAGATEYLRAAFRVWATEFRPTVRDGHCGCGTPPPAAATGPCGCASAPEPDADDVVLLARVDVEVRDDGDALVATGWAVDQDARPFVLHTRFLQEWLLGTARTASGPPPDPGNPIHSVTAYPDPAGPTATWDRALGSLDLGIPPGAAGAPGADGADGQGVTGATAVALPAGSPPTASITAGVLDLGIPAGPRGQRGPAGPDPGVQMLAAGVFNPDASPRWFFKGLNATQLDGSHYYLTYDGYDFTAQLVITGTVICRMGDPFHTFELVEREDDKIRQLITDRGLDPDRGFAVRILTRAQNVDNQSAFQVQVAMYR